MSRIIAPLTLLGAWVVFTDLLDKGGHLLPRASTTLERLLELAKSGVLAKDIGATAARWLQGYAAGALVGATMGVALGYWRPLYDAVEPLLDFFRSLPVTAAFPLFLLFFGIGDGTKVAMAFAATVFIVAINTAYGVFSRDPIRVETLRMMGASRRQLFTYGVVPEALPHVLLGLRVTLSLALIVVIVAEMFVGTRRGLGQLLFNSYALGLPADLYGGLLTVGLLGYGANKVFVSAERRLVHWVGK